MIIGIIGNGFVGKATFQLKCDDISILAYDINPDMCNPIGLKLEDMKQCEIIFISVPTPMSKDGSCHLNIINSVMDNLKFIDYKGFVVLRSTVPVGTSDNMNCYFMPEFLTEKNFINDFINNKEWFFGMPQVNSSMDANFIIKITELFNFAKKNDRINHNSLHFMSNKEAEMIKMFRNCFLATKISFCNEMYQFCNLKNVDYNKVRELATLDPRIGSSHTMVPGHDMMKGFGGTCFPKDTSSLKYEMTKAGMVPYVMNAITERNNTVDRPEKDWALDKGRATID